MRTRVKLRPGQRGTKRWLAHYGEQIVCIRYRYDALQRKRYTTVEIIVATGTWQPPPPAPATLVDVRIAWGEPHSPELLRLPADSGTASGACGSCAMTRWWRDVVGSAYKRRFRMTRRRTFTATFKTQVVLELLSGVKSMAQRCREHELKAQLVYRWKAEFLERAETIFGGDTQYQQAQERIAELERLVGRLTMEQEIAKKASQHPASLERVVTLENVDG